MSYPTCRTCAGLLARRTRPSTATMAAAAAAAAAVTTTTTTTTTAQQVHMRPLHQSCARPASGAQLQASLQPPPPPPPTSSRPRPRRPAAGDARSLHTTPRQAGIGERLGDMARQAVRRTVEPYGAFGVTRQMYEKCSKPAAYTISEEARNSDTVPTTEDGEEIGVGGGVWHDDFGLLPSFSTWSQVTMLHMYLVVTRLRCFDKETFHMWQSMLADHFFQEAEVKMDCLHHISSRGLRQRHLQDLFMAWRGVMVAYDEGLVRGDAVLAAALWRNLFKARPDVDLRALAAVVAWMRRSLARLDRMPDESLILHGGTGVFTWPPPSAHLAEVDVPATPELKLLMQEEEQQQQQQQQEAAAPESQKSSAAADA